ncbi:MAG: tRNA (adenosine(37)-N6)-dimethylallyltransferase MiaA [Candidatus Falkowbacteria bacterium]
MNNPRIIVIIGPTASGKTKLAVELARTFHGEIVSADSRQVYRGMDVGTGKDLVEYGDVPYHLIDVADPKEQFSVAEYKRQAEKAIDDIIARGKLPFLVGGSGLYVQAVVDNFEMNDKPSANEVLREELEQKSTSELLRMLQEQKPNFADKINLSDRKNKRRLIRYLEIGEAQEEVKINVKKYEALVLGLNPDKFTRDQKIKQRIIDRLENEDMVEEVAGLERLGVSWQRLHDFGLEYRFIADHLQEKIDYETMVDQLFVATRQFAKKQMTWFNRWEKQGQEIVWVTDVNLATLVITRFIR